MYNETWFHCGILNVPHIFSRNYTVLFHAKTMCVSTVLQFTANMDNYKNAK